MLKWVTSFPGNPRRGLPTVTGIVLVSDADNGEPLAMLDARAVTALRTGAAAAVADPGAGARGRAHASASSAAGCTALWVGPLPGRRGVRARRLLRPRPRRGRRGRRGARLGGRRPGRGARVRRRLHGHAGGGDRGRARRPCGPGQHLNLLGADGPGKAEATVEAVAARARRGPRLLRRVGAGQPRRRADGRGRGRRRAPRGRHGAGRRLRRARARARLGGEEITLFDSTGLAIQDLAIALGALEALRAGAVKPQTVSL